MPDKILYTGGPNPFKGLIGIFDDPKCPQGFCFDPREGNNCYCNEIESIKSNAPEVLNPEDTLVIYQRGDFYYHMGRSAPIKQGDIFDLPIGYEFKKEFRNPCIEAKDCLKPENGWKCMSVCKIGSEPVLRIVKTEVKEENIFEKEVKEAWDKSSLFNKPSPEESQKELLDAFLNKLYEYTKETKSAGLSPEDSKESVFEVLSTEFTIQRKK